MENVGKPIDEEYLAKDYQPLNNIEDVEEFYAAIDRKNLTRKLSPERPYTYWTLELYDQANGIRGGGGLGILAADTRRTAERMNVPLTLITPFYPSEAHQLYRNGETIDEHKPVNYNDYGFTFIDTIAIKCNNEFVTLDVIEKKFGATRIVSVTEKNFGELYSGDSNGDHRLYQQVALGFGGYQALKLLGLKPAIMQLNEVATFFAALARLDELASSGMDLYEALVYTRKHTLYTNHTLVQAAEANFEYSQFEKYVFPNLKSPAVKKWISDRFVGGHLRLSDVTIEVAEMRNGVSKLHARVANYHDIAGKRVKFKAITNGIDMPYWISPEIIDFYQEKGILDKFYLPLNNYKAKIEDISAAEVREMKRLGRAKLNKILARRPNQNGDFIQVPDDALVFTFKRRFVSYKRPWLPFTNPEKLRNILEKYNGYYFLSGRVHSGDHEMSKRLKELIAIINSDEVLKKRVHYLPDYDEVLARALSKGANIVINTPIVGLEACGTSWMKDIGNLDLLISTHDGGVADGPTDAYLNITGKTEESEARELYHRMEEAAEAWNNDFDLEYWLHRELSAYLPVISGTRMLKDYLNYLF